MAAGRRGARPGAPYSYLLLLTSRESSSDLVAGLEAGADDYIRKPFDAEELRARLRVGERILTLQNEERWKDGRSPYGLPKVRVLKVAKKPKKAKEEEAPAEGAAAVAAPAAAAEAKPAAKKGEKK